MAKRRRNTIRQRSMRKKHNTTVAQNPLVEGRQLELFNPTGDRHKPQILSIPGISPKQRDRYRVMLGHRIIGDFLNIDEAVALAKRGAK